MSRESLYVLLGIIRVENHAFCVFTVHALEIMGYLLVALGIRNPEIVSILVIPQKPR